MLDATIHISAVLAVGYTFLVAGIIGIGGVAFRVLERSTALTGSARFVSVCPLGRACRALGADEQLARAF